ncbi:hypothetical protein CEXT_605771 [Caerostris extrusa]|uniref:Uncharacterized protein n=1 Tax=Caerostris extrusa TaxID=172846 RepID=A0AAV4MEI4_CAEEX|nr:hypothetical protein CEXT_605771 [Caerostris extrusa]
MSYRPGYPYAQFNFHIWRTQWSIHQNILSLVEFPIWETQCAILQAILSLVFPQLKNTMSYRPGYPYAQFNFHIWRTQWSIHQNILS